MSKAFLMILAVSVTSVGSAQPSACVGLFKKLVRGSLVASVLVTSSLQAEEFSLPSTTTITTEEILTSGGSIRGNASPFYGHGYLIGRGRRAALDGIAFSTWELELVQGGFTDASHYIGSHVHLSTESEEVFEKAKALERHKLYVFEYIQKNAFDPELENAPRHVIHIFTPDEFLEKLKVESLPSQVTARFPFHGSKANDARKIGRVVNIERYGFWDNFCVFDLDTGGLGRNEKQFSVLDEELCHYSEKILALGRDVEVRYSTDEIEFWQPSRSFANSVRIIPRTERFQKQGGLE